MSENEVLKHNKFSLIFRDGIRSLAIDVAISKNSLDEDASFVLLTAYQELMKLTKEERRCPESGAV